MVEFPTFATSDAQVEEEEPEPTPQITVVEAGDEYGKFVAEPLPQGYGMTLGNPIRRVLYGSLPGSAVTWVKVEGVLHEYATIPHVKEEVAEFLLNVKDIRLRSEVDRPGKLRLEVAGQGEVVAGDIMASADFEVVNPELHLATLDSDDAKLSVELNVERGVGYSEAAHGDGLPIGVLPVDAIYTPMKKVNYGIESIRVGQRTDFERLVVEVWTDGSITPVEALKQAGDILVNHFFLFKNAQKESPDGDGGPSIPSMITPEQYNTLVEQLELSSRTLNCLKRAGIDKVGEILELSKAELLQIRNFGEKSLSELYDRLRERDLLPPDLDPDIVKEEEPEEAEETESADDEDQVEEQEAPVDDEAEVVSVGIEMPQIEGQGDES